MSMDGDSYRECTACEVLAFQPLHCVECEAEGRHGLVLCLSCRRECQGCHETVCVDHYLSHIKECYRRAARIDGDLKSLYAEVFG